MLRRFAPTLFLLAGIVSARGQTPVISEHPDSVAVTIYHNDGENLSRASHEDTLYTRMEGLALVTETRRINLPAGPSQIQFRGVAGTLVPQTANVAGVPVTESNFDFNLLTPGAVLEKSIGQSVHLLRTDPTTGVTSDQAAILRSGPNGVVLQIGNSYEALHCSGLPERIVFDHIPAGLYDTPTLTVRADAPKAGRYTITLRYLATGLDWSANYVARVGKDGRSLDLTGWITLANFSETGFADAPVDVIAGHVQATGSDHPPYAIGTSRSDACWPSQVNWASVIRFAAALDAARILAAPPAGSSVQTVTVTGTMIKARDLGDYKLYPLPEPTNVAANQTKQVQFLDQKSVPFARVYRVSIDANDQDSETVRPAALLLRLENNAKAGLGIPLPAGSILATTALPDDAAIVTGQDQLVDIPVGAPVEIADGDTSNVSARTRLLARITIGKRHRDTREVTVTNAKSVAVTFEWRQMSERGLTITAESRPHLAKDGGLVWSLALKPGEATTFRYTLDRP